MIVDSLNSNNYSSVDQHVSTGQSLHQDLRLETELGFICSRRSTVWKFQRLDSNGGFSTGGIQSVNKMVEKEKFVLFVFGIFNNNNQY